MIFGLAAADFGSAAQFCLHQLTPVVVVVVAATLAHKTVNIIFVPSDAVLLQFLRVDQDKECNMECNGAPRKPLCASDGRTFTSRCEFLRAKCRDPQLEVTRGPCKGQVRPPDVLECPVGGGAFNMGLRSRVT